MSRTSSEYASDLRTLHQQKREIERAIRALEKYKLLRDQHARSHLLLTAVLKPAA